MREVRPLDRILVEKAGIQGLTYLQFSPGKHIWCQIYLV